MSFAVTSQRMEHIAKKMSPVIILGKPSSTHSKNLPAIPFIELYHAWDSLYSSEKE